DSDRGRGRAGRWDGNVGLRSNARWSGFPGGAMGWKSDSNTLPGGSLLDGLYKAEYGINDAFGRSVMCMHAGKMLGGNSAFAHLGTYQQQSDGEISAEIITARHNDD